MTKLTQEQLEQAGARADAAQEGPWKFAQSVEGDIKAVYRATRRPEFPIVALPDYTRDDVAQKDGTFIAHARTDIPALLAHIRAVEAERDAAYEAAAQVAENKYEKNFDGDGSNILYFAGQRIAASIRALKGGA